MKYLKYFIFLLVLSACITDPYADSFKQATSFMEQNSYQRAYQIFKDLCDKNPDNQKFCDAKAKVQGKLLEIGLADAGKILNDLRKSSQPIPLSPLVELEKEINKLREYGANAPGITSILNEVQQEREQTQAKISAALARADVLFGEKKYQEMFVAIVSVKTLDPVTIGNKSSQYSAAVMEELYPRITAAIQAENWKSARADLELAMLVAPDYKDVKTLLTQAREKDSAQYFLAKAEEAKTAKKYQEAINYYEKAAAYPESSAQVSEKMQKAKVEFINYWFVMGAESMNQDLYGQAYNFFSQAAANLKTLPPDLSKSVIVPTDELNKYYGEMFNRAQIATEKKQLGAAYLYYHLIHSLSPGYPDLKKNLQTVEEKLTSRAVKSLAVMPFQSPKDAPDVGSVFTSSIILNLHKELSNDIKIIEREAVDALLKEYEISVASGKSEKDIAGLQISATNYLLLGEVLTSGVETTVQDATNTARVKTGTENVANPEYEQWERMYSERQRKGETVPQPPEKLIAKPIFENISYKTKYYKKIAYLTISYRVVDTSKGKLMHTSVVETNKEIKDESNEGVQIGEFSLPMKLAKLPSDVEMAKEVQKETLDKTAKEIKALFLDSEKRAQAEAEQMEKDGNIRDAVERYSDALMILKRKNLDYAKVEERLHKYIDVVSID